MKQGLADNETAMAKNHCNSLKEWLLENSSDKSDVEELFIKLCDTIERVAENSGRSTINLQ